MGKRWTWVAWFMVAIFVIGCGIAVTLEVAKGGFDPDTLTLYLAFTGFMVVGAVIVAQTARQRHRPGSSRLSVFWPPRAHWRRSMPATPTSPGLARFRARSSRPGTSSSGGSR